MKTELSLVSSLLVVSLAASAVTFEWDHSPDPLVVGYRLYWGTNSDAYTASQPSPGRTNVITVTNAAFLPNVPYYFTVVATNAAGIESLPSNIVSWTNIVRPLPPKNIRVVVDITQSGSTATATTTITTVP